MKDLGRLCLDGLHPEIIDILPNPVLVKDEQLRYVLVNTAFEDLHNVRREDLIGRLDTEVFVDRQAVQCNAGDLRVLQSGEIDEAYETVWCSASGPRETITRKSRLTLTDGRVFLVGIMHDITDVTCINRQLKESQDLLQHQAEALERMANTDPLTGCSNRRAFLKQAPPAFATHNNKGGVLILDIDHFKKINDTYGHDAGDAILVQLTQTIRQILRNSDDIVRLGGEEFAIVLPGASVGNLSLKAEAIRQLIESTPMYYADQTIAVTVSIGVAIAQSESGVINLDRLLTEGDHCLYEAKNKGRNCVVDTLPA